MGKWVIGGLSTWESVAMLSGLVPTITSTTKRLPVPLRRLVVGGFSVWLFVHMETVPSSLADRLFGRPHYP